MAMYGFDMKTISRLRGESVAKTTAYILRSKIPDPYLHQTHYYSQVKDLLYSEILIPEYAPKEFLDLDTLIAAMECAEKRYDARTGRVVRLSLPNDKEFTDRERFDLARAFVKEAFISQGMCAVIAIHAGKNKDPAKNNPHAHILLTDRPVDTNGFCAKKNRDWNKTAQLRKYRALWAEMQNRAFKEKSMEVRVSHESLEVQGIDRQPTRPLGRAATALERKGIPTEIGNRNREIEAQQREREERRQLMLERHRQRNRSR